MSERYEATIQVGPLFTYWGENYFDFHFDVLEGKLPASDKVRLINGETWKITMEKVG